MPRARSLPLDVVRKLLAGGATQAEIARRTGASPATVSRAIAQLKKEPAPDAQEVRRRVDADVGIDVNADAEFEADPEAEDDPGLWDTQAAAEKNYAEAVKLRDGKFTSQKDKRAAVTLAQQCMKFAMEMRERSYGLRQMQAFIDEVLAELDEIDPAIRDRIIQRLKARAALPGSFTGT